MVSEIAPMFVVTNHHRGLDKLYYLLY